MVTISAFYSVWNEAESIALSMRSVEDLVDKIVVADGRYTGSGETLPNNSTDGTQDIVRRFPKAELILCPEPLHQVDKWNLCRNTGTDWTLIMAGHQILVGDLPRLRHELGYNQPYKTVDIDVYSTIRDLMAKRSYRRCRIFHKNSGFHFSKHHWIRMDDKGNIIDGRGRYVDFVSAICLHELRSKERVKIKDGYLLWRSANPNEAW